MEYTIWARRNGGYQSWKFGSAYDIAVAEFSKIVSGLGFDSVHLVGNTRDGQPRLFACYDNDGFEALRTQ